MSELADIITGEFEEAVEVKNPKSLQRGIYLLLTSTVRKEEHEKEHDGLKSAIQTMSKNIELLALEMKEGFKRMDERFEASDKRFEASDKKFETMERRFEAMEKNFTKIATMLTIGFLTIATLITILKFIM